MKLKMLFVILLAVMCQAVLTQTVYEGFEGTYPVPGWDCDSVARVDQTVTTPHSGSYCVMFDTYADYLISPLIVQPGILSLWHKKDTGNASSFYVQVSTSTSGPWTSVATVTPGQGWSESVIDLSAYSNIYIRWFFVGPPPPEAKTMYLDDISWVDYTVPVELSSFTGIITPQNYIMLEWITQSETAVSGYYIFRNRANDLSAAERINAFIQATNTSQEASYVFIDSEAMPGYTYYYWLQHIDLNGENEFHGPVSIHLPQTTTDLPTIPLETSLQNIYPNPFNPSTTISYGLAKAASIEIVVMNLKGQIVRRLVSESKNSGTHSVRWDGRNDNGIEVTTGTYLVSLTAGSHKELRKLILLK